MPVSDYLHATQIDNGYGGYDDALILSEDGYSLLLGEEACDCCGCCQTFQDGVLDAAGKIVYESSILEAIVTPPTLGARGYCGGDDINVVLNLKSPHDVLPVDGYYFFHMWLDRDWHHVDHSPILGGKDEAEGANWFVWFSDSPSVSINLRYMPCWISSHFPVGYAKQYAELFFGTRVGDPINEVLLIESLEQETDKDCCPYPTSCRRCAYVFPPVDDDTGPEETEEGIQYWVEKDGWAVRNTIIEGPNLETKLMERGDRLEIESAVRPRKDTYLYYENLEADFCWETAGWISAAGEPRHPQIPVPSLPEMLPSTTCCPATFLPASDAPCHDLTRDEVDTSPALIRILEATITECTDCVAVETPLSPKTKVCVTDGNSSTDMTLELLMQECPNNGPNCCVEPEVCCLKFTLDIENYAYPGEWTVDAIPDADTIASGTIKAGSDGVSVHTWKIFCYPNPDDEDAVGIETFADSISVHNTDGPVRPGGGTVCLRVEEDPLNFEDYKICITCDNTEGEV